MLYSFNACSGSLWCPLLATRCQSTVSTHRAVELPSCSCLWSSASGFSSAYTPLCPAHPPPPHQCFCLACLCVNRGDAIGCCVSHLFQLRGLAVIHLDGVRRAHGPRHCLLGHFLCALYQKGELVAAPLRATVDAGFPCETSSLLMAQVT